MSKITEITNGRRIAFGPTDRLMSMAHIKYRWAIDVYSDMEANTWFTKSVAMGADRDQYRSGALSPAEKRAYDYALAFVSNLDGIQFNNLIHNIGQHITAPEVSLAIARQAAEEGLHVRAYQTMIESISLDPDAIYMLFETDGLLAAKNAAIMAQSDVLKDDPTPANFARAVIGNIVLEGIYFYSAFLIFYILARNGKMIGSADSIKYINRDEGGTHLTLFANIHRTFQHENPEIYDEQFWVDAEKIFRSATEMEITWGQYIVGEGFPGATQHMMTAFVQDLANKRWQLVRPGSAPLYPGVTNPAPWFDDFAVPNGTRTNFFEGKPTDYAADGLEW